MPSNVLPLHLNQTFPHIFWIFIEVEGDGVKWRLSSTIFFTLLLAPSDFQTCRHPWVQCVLFYILLFQTHSEIQNNPVYSLWYYKCKFVLQFYVILWVNWRAQLNNCETGPYFLQNFKYTTMFISKYCKIFELNTERKSVFAADVSGVSLKVSSNFFRTISGSQMGSQPLQNTEIIKQTDFLLWKISRI